ncbi:putative hydrolase of the HAD superfamily [Agitococcus lubricus]|uniref:Putative hydrolase of the HAD superfamily n=2 Tax=Agitococcus lubricus TaxID=1077255 RepID=A0A2T5J010_9GAMM|nr:putative hydrolase of the HAD superfamily [Agitococcus lubricus]
MDGTLLDLHFDNHFWQQFVPQKYAEKHGLSVEESQKQLFPRFKAQYGTLNWYCLDYWSQQLDLNIVALKRELQHLIRMRVDALHFLQSLANSNKQVWMVTNAHPHALALKLERTAIAPYFQRIISSHEFGKPKEFLQFWHELQQYLHFDPRRTLFIDDSEAVLETAQRFGIEHILSISHPDSLAPERTGLKFPAINQFAEILPIEDMLC